VKTVLFDIESNGLLDTITTVHTLQIGDADGTDAVVYTDNRPGFPSIADGLARLAAADRVVGHHLLGYDFPVMERFYPGALKRWQIYDTLVATRLLDPEERTNTLASWGDRLGVAKGEFKGPWDVLTDEMIDYARQDIVVTRALYQHVEPQLRDWGHSLDLEHEVAWAIHLQEQNGFTLDVAAAQKLDAELRGAMADLEAQLRQSFPPIAHVSIAKATNKKVGIVKGQPRTKWEHFEPGSRHHIARRLQALGWRPKDFNKDSTPVVDEKILAEMPWPEAQLLLKYLRTQKLLGQLSDGKGGWLKMVRPDGRIHGRVNPNGACTGRMSHMSPNVAQADKDPRMRALWLPRDGWVLVGCDADGLEARMLGHYLARYDGGAFVKTLLDGRKEDGSDIHSRNRDAVRAAGFAVDRDGAKTLLYALMYGAGDWKLAATVKDNLRATGQRLPKIPHKEMGLLVRRALAKSMTGIDKLIDAVKAAAKERGYLIGLDGRHLNVRSDHAALNTLLQGAGAVVMKRALVEFMRLWGERQQLFGLCANVHDEVQIECVPEMAETFGDEFASCIRSAGEYYKLRCPLSGAYQVGSNWAETH
jgi:DNA polymerase-1